MNFFSLNYQIGKDGKISIVKELEKCIAEGSAESEPMPKSCVTFINKGDWQLKSLEDERSVELMKKIGNHT